MIAVIFSSGTVVRRVFAATPAITVSSAATREQEQAAVEQGQPKPHRPPAEHAGCPHRLPGSAGRSRSRYPVPTRVSISGGLPSFLRNQETVGHDIAERVGVDVPDMIEQLLGADHATVRGDEHFKHAELLAGQHHQLARPW